MREKEVKWPTTRRRKPVHTIGAVDDVDDVPSLAIPFGGAQEERTFFHFQTELDKFFAQFGSRRQEGKGILIECELPVVRLECSLFVLLIDLHFGIINW